MWAKLFNPMDCNRQKKKFTFFFVVVKLYSINIIPQMGMDEY